MKGTLITLAIIEYILLILGNQYFGLTTFILINLSFGLVALGLILKKETFRFLSIVFFSFSAIVDSIVLLNSKAFVLVTMSLFFALCGEIIAILINDQKNDIENEIHKEHKEETHYHEKTKSLEKELPDDEIKDVIYIKSKKADKEKSTKKKTSNNRKTKSASKKSSKSKKKTTKSVNKQGSSNIGIKKIHVSRNKTKSRKIFGSVHSNLFHYTGCKVGARILDKNKIFFKSESAAWNKHYHKHKCKIATYKY